MAALLGALERSVSGSGFSRWPKWRFEGGITRLSKSSLSKMFRREGGRGGVERGARLGTRSLSWWLEMWFLDESK